MVYKIPKEEVRPLHFAYHSIFGLKEPIFCEEHLALLEENALLELKSDIPPYCVPIWLRKHKNGIFQVSFKVKLALSQCRLLFSTFFIIIFRGIQFTFSFLCIVSFRITIKIFNTWHMKTSLISKLTITA